MSDEEIIALLGKINEELSEIGCLLLIIVCMMGAGLLGLCSGG